MTRTRFAAFALVSLLAASCSEVPTAPFELGPAPELTPPAPAPMLPAPAGEFAPAVVEVDGGFTLQELEKAPWLIEPYLDPVRLRATRACEIVNDVNPPDYCCPEPDSGGRGHAVATVYNPYDDEIVTFGDGETIKPYPLVVLADRWHTVRYVVWGVHRRDREWPEPTDIPALFFVLEGILGDVRYGLPMCPGGRIFPRVYPGTAPKHMAVVRADGFGLLWEFERGDPATNGGQITTEVVCRARIVGPEAVESTCCPVGNPLGVGPRVGGNRAERTDTGLLFPEEAIERYNRLGVVDKEGYLIEVLSPDEYYGRQKGVEFYTLDYWGQEFYFRPGCRGFEDESPIMAEITDLTGPGLEVVILEDGLPAIQIYFGP